MPIPAAFRFLAASSALETLLQGPQRSMAVAGLLFAAMVYLTILVAGILIIVRAFRASIAWGLIVLFVPFGHIAFVCTHWQETKNLS